MRPMSDQPVTLAVLTTALAQFHRDVILPDMHRTFESLFERLVKPRFDEIDGRFDAVFHKLDKLETEYQALKSGLARVEEELRTMDRRLGGIETQYRDLLAAVNRLEERLRRVEKQLSRVESQVDALVAAREKDTLRVEVADLRTRVDNLQAQVRSLEKRFEQ